MFGETSKLNAVDTKIKFRDFIENTNVVDLCKKEYCISTLHAAPKRIILNKTIEEILEKFKSGEALGNDLSSCQRECSDLRKAQAIPGKAKSECDSRCSKHYNLKPRDKVEHDSCKKKCIKNEEAIKSAAKEYYENKKEEIAQKLSDDEIEKHKTHMKLLIDKKYDKLIEDANKQFRESQLNAEKMKGDQEKRINLLKKETLVVTQNVDAEKMKQELLDKIKELMSPKQEFLNLLVKENYVVDKVCKNDYCNKQEEKELSKCNSECEDSKEFEILNDREYKECKTNCQKEKESKKYECEGRCYLKQEDIKSAAKEYYQEIKNNTSKEKFDASKMEQGFLDKVQEIMENTFPSELEYSVL
ncbi:MULTISPECIES: hypothetical protein [unclassified Wolbachia]|uniref:hypothetical protein n=1 Tax=unclassified Wolbachia TaxID=2640676 RepID=UPI003132F30A